jgi:AcrR family transcriptional regulator
MSEPRERPPPETRRAIMEATYRAIGSSGYADLTMAAIAGEFEKSQSLIHYHYDTKEELLAAFLAYLMEEFVGKVESGHLAGDSTSPRETLSAVVDALLVGPDDRERLHAVLLELRAQSLHDATYREQFVENEGQLRELLAGLVADCVEAGELPAVDEEALARRILIAIDGARNRRIVLGDDVDLHAGRSMVEALLESPPEDLLGSSPGEAADGSPEADA